ncbi:MAG TPA: hypothetical protein VLW45_09235 [Pelomicrobium sp.]|nr:hypothetical protein [Pelomicrobium sp.]
MHANRLRWFQLAAWIGLIGVFFTLALETYAPGLAALGSLLIAACVILQLVLETRSTRQAYDEAYEHWMARYGHELSGDVRDVEHAPRLREARAR